MADLNYAELRGYYIENALNGNRLQAGKDIEKAIAAGTAHTDIY